MHHPKYSNTHLFLLLTTRLTPNLFQPKTMSHGQPRKPEAAEQEPSKYGNVYSVSSAVKDGHVLGKHVEPHAPVVPTGIGSAAIDGDPITIGEALEVVAISVGNKPVDQNDAAAISAAEIRATEEMKVSSGGVGERAQAAATLNSHVIRVQDMTRVSDILTDAAEKLYVDKAVTKEDAEAAYAAEGRSGSGC